MYSYKCTECSRLFNVEEDPVCPRCGAAVPPSVLARIERDQVRARLRSEGARPELIRAVGSVVPADPASPSTQPPRGGSIPRNVSAPRSGSASARPAPRRQAAKKKRDLTPLMPLILPIVAVLFFLIQNTMNDRRQSDARPGQQAVPAAEYEVKTLGQTVFLPDCELSAEALWEYEPDTREKRLLKDGERIVALALRLKNRTDRRISQERFWGWAETASGELADLVLHTGRTNALPSGELAAGKELYGELCFRIPEDAVRLILFYGDEAVFDLALE